MMALLNVAESIAFGIKTRVEFVIMQAWKEG
jgi:hypothetical protein